MTHIFLVRHAQPDFSWEEDRTRPLTKEGIEDSKKVTELLRDKHIHCFFSSPYKRSIDTIKESALEYQKEIKIEERFRERESGKGGNQKELFEKRWSDFAFSEKDGETLKEVQDRNIQALMEILKEHSGKNIVIGTHGTALSTILNYYNNLFDCNDFFRIIDYMPYIVRLDFDGLDFINIEEVLIVEKEFEGENGIHKKGNVKFYLPDFYHGIHMNRILYEMMKKYPDYFYENVEIGAVYGSFPGAIWNGGRVVLGGCTKEEIVYILSEFNDRKIPCRYTFTNPLIQEKHVQDTFCNLCMELGDNGMNEVLVNSPVLEAYIRKNYPNYKILSSTTKCLKTTQEVIKETEQDYHLIVLDNSFNNSEKLFALDKKEKYELVVNSYCQDSCPNRERHYASVGASQLTYDTTSFEPCQYINRDFYDLMNNRSFITVENVYGLYYQSGFYHFKIDGRGFNHYKVMESYMYYFVKPEYRDIVRLSFFRAVERF